MLLEVGGGGGGGGLNFGGERRDCGRAVRKLWSGVVRNSTVFCFELFTKPNVEENSKEFLHEQYIN